MIKQRKLIWKYENVCGSKDQLSLKLSDFISKSEILIRNQIFEMLKMLVSSNFIWFSQDPNSSDKQHREINFKMKSGINMYLPLYTALNTIEQFDSNTHKRNTTTICFELSMSLFSNLFFALKQKFACLQSWYYVK